MGAPQKGRPSFSGLWYKEHRDYSLKGIFFMLTAATRFFRVLLAVFIISIAARANAAEPASPYLIEIADVGKSQEFAALLKAKGYATAIPPKNIWVVDVQSNSAVWIGKKVPLEMLQVVIPEALRFNPYIKFFHVVGDRGEQPPEKVDNTIHVGGNIEAALVKKLNQIESRELLDKLAKAKSLDEFHGYLHEKNSKKAD